MRLSHSEIYRVKKDSPEWNYMWDELAKNPLNAGQPDPFDCESEGECWQYMDSGYVNNKWVHEFRHRYHPVTKLRWYLRIPVKDKTALVS